MSFFLLARPPALYSKSEDSTILEKEDGLWKTGLVQNKKDDFPSGSYSFQYAMLEWFFAYLYSYVPIHEACTFGF